MVLYNEPMKLHTTFRVGGPAKVYVQPETVEELVRAVGECVRTQSDYIVIGNGSNLIVSDRGYSGTVIDVSRFLTGYTVENTDGSYRVTAQAGVMLGRLGNELARLGAAGFEFACGIPGCMGGAVAMNAGAYGREMKDCLCSVTVLLKDGVTVAQYGVDELDMGYRTSRIQTENMTVLEAVMEFSKGDTEEIRRYIGELSGRRREKQPLEYPSVGSTFKRPRDHFAGKLIEEAGLKGYGIGGMQVSEKHAGFVINKGNGTAQDFVALTDYIIDKVKQNSGIELELEVKLVGFEQ